MTTSTAQTQSSTPTLTLSYKVSIPPTHASAQIAAAPTDSLSIPLISNNTAAAESEIDYARSQSHLIALESALDEARSWMNGRMTEWRTALAGAPSEQRVAGLKGQGKAGKKGNKDDEDLNDEDDEEGADDEDE